MLCCWAGLFKTLLPVNLENCRSQNFGEYPINDWGVCPGCRNIVIRMLGNYIQPDCMCVQTIKDWCNGADLKQMSTMTHIVNWKLLGVYSPRIFIAMCDHGITPYMMEHFTIERIQRHCLKMIDGKPENWPFYKMLAKKGPDVQEKYDLLKTKVISDEVSLSADQHADSDQRDHIKKLTKFVRYRQY